MLKTTRRILAVLSLTAITLLLLDTSGFAAKHLDWLAKIQLVPAVLSLPYHLLIVVGLLVLTLLLGRVYCSVICPLGIFQDVVIRLRTLIIGRKSAFRFSFTPERPVVRYGILTLFVALFVLGAVNVIAMSLAGLLEPYSEYGRIATQLFGPLYDAGENALASWSEAQGNYIFTPVAHATTMPVLVVAIVTFVVVVVMALFGGRAYCNMVCPVGTLLGFLSRFAWLRPVIDTDRCNGCRSCERKCKAECIDAKNHKIDYSRCVVCMDCIDNCRQGAISYTHKSLKYKPKSVAAEPDKSRRSFITAGTIAAGSLIVSAKEEGDGALEPLKAKKRAVRKVKVVPAGAQSIAHLTSHCTACQLCINECPEGVLRPSTSLDSFMQPVMWFNESYCRPECTRCSEVCPTGAIRLITPEDKSSTKIGTAVIKYGHCLTSKGEHCRMCVRSCPAGAISIVKVPTEDGGHRSRPVVNEEACIGCGSCEYHCPVGKVGHIRHNHAAIHVEGIEVHRTI